MGVKHASFTKLHLDKVGQEVRYPWWLIPVILVYARLKDRQIFSSKIKPVQFTCATTQRNVRYLQSISIVGLPIHDSSLPLEDQT